MPEPVALLLRGINVGGRHKLPMAQLRTIIEELGGAEPRTLLQSGNAVTGLEPDEAAAFGDRLEAELRRRLDFEVPVVVRTAAEWATVIDGNPFRAETAEPKQVHVAFLREATPGNVGLDPDRSPPDRAILRGRELYLHLPNGVARTRFTTAYLDRTLGTVTTARNWNTVLKLWDLLRGS